MRKEIPGLEQTTSPRYTTILIRKLLRKSNPWYQAEAVADFALGHRYSCGLFGTCQEIKSEADERYISPGLSGKDDSSRKIRTPEER
ncbi:MAG: hypothetical protein OIN88_01960 [Candidatus Methanoperedens sp.]|nr:hypothetical protein [Candidatus Methanoperedens sp.]MCZ7359027.1 hypothetical protein [Candidatus Methanoperedens sp.]HLB71019.1 hypothetical protein [Candidatus Methanoperedens sp.]